MSVKTALKILLVIIFIGAIVLGATLYLKEKFYTGPEMAPAVPELTEVELQNIVNKKNADKELSKKEERQIDALITKKVEVKREELNKKTDAEIKANGYTQEEAEFILEPRGTVEKELGIQSKPAKPLTQEEVNAILNPKK